MSVEENLTSSGERLKRARVLAGLDTRREFEERHHISANTLQGWEQGKNPLSEKGAKRVIEALKSEGLICSIEWLLYGKGMPPRPYEILSAGLRKNMADNSDLTEMNLQEEQAIYHEIQGFKEHNPNAIVLSVADNAMEPYFAVGDYVGGVQVFGKNMDTFINRVCIIEFENNQILPRLLQQSQDIGLYTASCTNPHANASPLNLYNVKVISVAPIIWHRKKLASLC